MIALFGLPLAALAADGFDAHGFDATPSDGDLTDPLAVWRAEPGKAGLVGGTALFEYADRPLVFVNPDGTERPLLDNVVALNLGMVVGVHERVSVAVGLPLVLASTGESGAQGPTLADARIAVPVGLLLPEGNGLSASIVPFVDLPLGSTARMLGTGGAGAGGVAALRATMGALEVDANVGGAFEHAVEVTNLRGGGRLLLGGAVAYGLSDALAARGEVVWKRELNDGPVPGTESPGEAMLSVRGRQGVVSWTVGGAHAITAGAGAARFRVFLGVGFASHTPTDTDLDGLSDKEDTCPTVPETGNGWKDEDGCADDLAEVRLRVVDPRGQPVAQAAVEFGAERFLTDTDGVVSLHDRTPGTDLAAGSVSLAGYEKATVAALHLTEGENVAEIALAWTPVLLTIRATGVLPSERRPLDAGVSFVGEGAPADLTLGPDGVETVKVLPYQHLSALVRAEGWLDERRDIDPRVSDVLDLAVEMKPAKAVITRTSIDILEQVNFDFGESTIQPESYALLDQVAQILNAHPNVRLVEVQGHADDRGDDAWNLALSQRRMEAVVSYLVGTGHVAATRLSPRGYGETLPLVPNNSDANRAKNRRVQFVILDPKAP